MDEIEMDKELVALEALAAVEEKAAANVALSDVEARKHAALTRIAAAREAAANAEQKRRDVDGGQREAVAKAAAASGGKRYTVRAIDLVACFPVGQAPALELFPCRGVIVVRSAPKDVANACARELEAKKRPAASILTDLICGSLLDPGPENIGESAKVRAFLEEFPHCATNVGNVVYEMGGLRTQAEKRG